MVYMIIKSDDGRYYLGNDKAKPTKYGYFNSKQEAINFARKNNIEID